MGQHFGLNTMCVNISDIETKGQRPCVRLQLQIQNWSQFAGLVTFGALGCWGAAGGANRPNDCDDRCQAEPCNSNRWTLGFFLLNLTVCGALG